MNSLSTFLCFCLALFLIAASNDSSVSMMVAAGLEDDSQGLSGSSEETCDCTDECRQLVKGHLESARQEFETQLGLSRQEDEQAHQRAIQELEATWGQRLQEQEAKFEEASQAKIQEQDLEQIIADGEKSLSREISLREEKEALVAQLQAEMDKQVSASAASQHELQTTLNRRVREVELQKERVKSTQAALEKTQRDLQETKDKFFTTRQDYFRANQHIRDMEASATYVNVTMISQDLGQLGKNVADGCAMAGTRVVDVVTPWWDKFAAILYPLLEALQEAYRTQVAPFLSDTVRPALDSLLKLVLKARRAAVGRANIGVKRACRSILAYLELQEGESKIRSHLTDVLETLESQSDMVVAGLEILLFLVLLFGFLRYMSRKKSKGASLNPKKSSVRAKKVKTQ